MPHVRIRAGGGPQGPSLPRSGRPSGHRRRSRVANFVWSPLPTGGDQAQFVR